VDLLGPFDMRDLHSLKCWLASTYQVSEKGQVEGNQPRRQLGEGTATEKPISGQVFRDIKREHE
jgi:hypothetical protein